jgi:hypothetical protein
MTLDRCLQAEKKKTKSMTVKELEEIFSRIIDKLKFEIDENSQIDIETDTYRIIPAENWNNFDDSANWNSAKEIDLGSLKDDIEELEKLVKNKDRICTYVDFDRVASLLREISQINNPIE